VKMPKRHRFPQESVVLIWNTTWKCGRVEREIIRFLRDNFRFETSIKDLLAHFELVGVSSNLPDAIRRLENRGIIKSIRR